MPLLNLAIAFLLLLAAGGTIRWYRYEGHRDLSAWLVIGAEVAGALLVLALGVRA